MSPHSRSWSTSILACFPRWSKFAPGWSTSGPLRFQGVSRCGPLGPLYSLSLSLSLSNRGADRPRPASARAAAVTVAGATRRRGGPAGPPGFCRLFAPGPSLDHPWTGPLVGRPTPAVSQAPPAWCGRWQAGGSASRPTTTPAAAAPGPRPPPWLPCCAPPAPSAPPPRGARRAGRPLLAAQPSTHLA